MSPARAALGTLIMLLACGLVVCALGDRPLRPLAPEPGHTRGALAVRDDVIPFQKWGSKVFTVPRLEGSYDEVAYFTMFSRGDKREPILAALTGMLERHEAVDIYLLAHSNEFVDWIWTLPETQRARIRMVYNTGCGDAFQAQQWRELGVEAYIGHPGEHSVSPVFYVFFLRRWLAGWALDEAVADANEKTRARLELVGPATRGKLDGEAIAHDSRAELSGAPELVFGGRE